MKTFNTYTLEKGNAEELVSKALKNLAWDYRKTTYGYEVDFGKNFKTWGSTMDISFVEENEFNVSVKTEWPVQIIDWGDGKNKIEELIREVKRLEQ